MTQSPHHLVHWGIIYMYRWTYILSREKSKKEVGLLSRVDLIWGDCYINICGFTLATCYNPEEVRSL